MTEQTTEHLLRYGDRERGEGSERTNNRTEEEMGKGEYSERGADQRMKERSKERKISVSGVVVKIR